jgi:hypothetical protein
MTRLSSCISALALGVAAPATAQVAAEDIWAEWQAASAATGQQMSADVAETADGLVLTDFTTRIDQQGTLSVGRVERIALVEQTDGTLSVEVSSPYTLSLTFPDEESGGNVTLEILLTYEDLDIDVSGPPEARAYAYTATALTVTDGAISSDTGAPLPEIDIEIVARDVAATYDLQGAPGTPDQRFDSASTVGSLAGRFDVTPPPGEEGQVKATFATGAMTSTASGTLVALATLQQASDGLPDGFELDTMTDYDGIRFDMSLDSPEAVFALSYANAGGTFGLAFSEAALRYDISAEDIEMEVSGSDIPVPVAASAAGSELSLAIPLAARPEPSEAAVRLGYRELELGDGVWSMIDPTGGVPRSPLTLILDATAQVQLTADLMDPATMESQQPPGELRSLTVSELEVSFGDTSLTGTANMTFAPGQPMPQPLGEANIRLSGGNALLDQLQSAGVIGPEQAGMARGVAGMFSRPGAAPDTLETTIEFLEGGGITANGVPLQ